MLRLNFSAMSVKEYVQFGSRKGGSEEFGIFGYTITKINPLDKPQIKNIKNNKRKTYLDDAVKEKRDVPNKFYNTMRNLVDKQHKSNLCKAPRTSVWDEIAKCFKKNPAPGAHKPSFNLVHRNHSACLSYKSDRVAFCADAQWRGENMPEFHSKKHELTERRCAAPVYKPPSSKDKEGPAFLRESRATKLISPVTYNAQDSFNKTQTHRVKFF